ncbi:Crp/Fnr family transcriptional regulator [bacterium]|nr:Crp/Fnr family transcriptional regulator [bacterium]
MQDQDSSIEQLKTFLSGFPELSKEAVNKLTEMIPVVSFKKGSIILEEGDVPQECYHVLKGLVREFRTIDGDEKTTEFYDESKATISSSNYSNQTPSEFSLECMEDCLLIAGNMEIDEAHYKEFPELIEITRNMLESDLNNAKSMHSKFILSSPKERYLHLMETRPGLLNRVPLYQIASYLGMTAESLSRIRKRLLAEKE